MGCDDERFERLKVGELRAALAGAHDDVRVVDVPAFQALLNEPLQEWKKSFFASVGTMWALLDRLSLEFSQQAEGRDLELARCMAEHAGAFSGVLMAYKLELPDRLQLCGNVEAAIDEAVAHSAASGLHNLAEALEALRRGVAGSADDVSKARSTLQAMLSAKAHSIGLKKAAEAA